MGDDRTFENPDGCREIIDSSCGSQGCGDDARRGNEIVGEAIVEIALSLKILESAGFSLDHWDRL